MNHCLHSVLSQMLLHEVTMWSEYGENVEDALLPIVVGWQAEQRVVNLLNISQGNASPSLVLCIKISQLDIEDGSLYLVEATVSSAMVEDILPRRAVVGERTEKAGKLLIVGSYGTTIAQSAKILAWVEAVAVSEE